MILSQSNSMLSFGRSRLNESDNTHYNDCTSLNNNTLAHISFDHKHDEKHCIDNTIHLPSLRNITNSNDNKKQTEKHLKTLQLSILHNQKWSYNGTCELDVITTNLTLNSTIYELKQYIKHKYKIKNKISLLIIYSHSILDNDNYTLASYGIDNNSCLFVAICDNKSRFNSWVMDGDEIEFDINLSANTYYTFQETQRNIINELRKLKTFKSIKISDLDILTYETVSNCIQMPCGHGITPETLYYFTESEYKSGKILIKCPHMINNNQSKCNQIWYYPIIRKILTNTCIDFDIAKKLQKLEILSSLNTFKTHFQISRCPNCLYHIYRHCDDNTKKDNRTICIMCSKKYNRTIFCWKCKNIENKCVCCNLETECYKILANCTLKQIGEVYNVPSIRSCPNSKCRQLIYHTDACKHMQCNNCKTDFCFVCLKQTLNGNWQCGSHSDRCPIAPKQVKQINVGVSS